MPDVHYLLLISWHRLYGNEFLVEELTQDEIVQIKLDLDCNRAPTMTRHLIPKAAQASNNGYGLEIMLASSLKGMIMELQAWEDSNPHEELPGSAKVD